VKLSINKILSKKYLVKLRNILNLRPLNLSFSDLMFPTSISDAFCWRTDNGYYSVFKYIDILKLFYQIKNSEVEIIFYTNRGSKIKNINLKKIRTANILKIDKKLLNGLESYGTFNIFHKTNNIKKNIIISNRCYVGYSRNKSLPSFVHGNTFAKYKDIKSDFCGNDIIKINKKNNIYKIQKSFKDIKHVEFFLSNPTSEKIDFSINNQNYQLDVGHCKIINLSNLDTIIIKSNCYYLRPIIFNYNNKYIDVHHG
tara:strand:+ start:462 stop:1226 length:765 start_codon:yes stop_codon:yes gene_type:complete